MTSSYVVSEEDRCGSSVFPIHENSEDMLERRRPLTYGTRSVIEPMPKRRRSSAASDADNYVPAHSPAPPSYLSSSAPGFLASKCASGVVAMDVDNEGRRDGLTQTPVSSPGSTPPSSAGESPPESVRVSPKENPVRETEGKEEGKESAAGAEMAEGKRDMPIPLVNALQPVRGTKEDDKDTSKSSSLAKVEEEDSDLAEHDDDKHAVKKEELSGPNKNNHTKESCAEKPARASPHLQTDPSDAVASPTPLDDGKKDGSAPSKPAGIPLLHFLNAERQGIPPMSFMSGSVPMPVANAQYQLQTLPCGSTAAPGPVPMSSPPASPAPGPGPTAQAEVRQPTIIPPKPLPSFRDMIYCMPNEKGAHPGAVPPMKAESGIQSVYAPPPPQDKVPQPTSMPMTTMVPPIRGTQCQTHPDSKEASPRAETAVNLTPTVTHINYPIRRVSMSRFFSFVDPTGHVYTVSNLRGFCQARGLNRAHMSSVFRGKRQHHKGWRRASVPGVPFPEENAQLSGRDDDTDDENDDQVPSSSGMPTSVGSMRCGPRGSGPRGTVGDVRMVCSLCSKDSSSCQCQRTVDTGKGPMIPRPLTSYDGKTPLLTPTQEVAAMDLSTPRSDNSGERRASGGFSHPGPVVRRPSGSSGANLLDLIAKCAEDVNTKTTPFGAAGGSRPRSYSMMNPTVRRDSIVSSSQDMMHRPRTDSLPHAPRPRKDSINSEGARVRSKLFAFVDPYGNKYQVDNLSKLCEMFDLTPSTMSKVHRGVRLQHKGWQRVETEEKLGIVLPSSIRKAPAIPAVKPGLLSNSGKIEGPSAGATCNASVKTSPDPSSDAAKGKGMPAPSFAPTMPLDTESETDSDDSNTSFHFVDANGNAENPVDLLAFCQVRGLSFTMMKKVSRGTIDSHKGWKRKGENRPVNGSSIGSVDEELDKIHDTGNEKVNESGRAKSPSNSPQSFAFIDPHGVRHECSKLSSFCRTHNLTQSSMSKVHRGVRFQHKGWRKADGGKARTHRRSGATAEAARATSDRMSDSDTDSDMDEANEGDGEGRGLRLYQKVSTSFSFTDPSGKTHNVINLSKFCDDHKLARSAMSKVHRGIRPQHKGWRKTETPASAPRLSYAFIGPNGELAEVSDLSRFCQSYNLQLGSMKDVARGELAQHEGWRNADETDSSDDDDTPLNEIMKKSKNASQGRGDKAVSQTGFIVNGGERRKSRGRPSNLSRKLAAARAPDKETCDRATTRRENAVTGLHFLAFASEQIETMGRTVQS